MCKVPHDQGPSSSDEDDQRENARREHEAARILSLAVSEQAIATTIEVARQRQYDAMRVGNSFMYIAR